jgi:radical SAM superfamily enzyme YgiQ (UPF0313 family)
MKTQAITWLHSKPADLQRRVVLVDVYWTRDKDPRVPLGHGCLLAALRADPAIDARSIVLPVNSSLSATDIAARILAETAGLPPQQVDVAIGAYIWNERVLQLLLPALRSRGFRGRIILGGPQVSYVAGGLESLYPEADVFIRGQAETALHSVVRAGGRTPIRGVHYAGDEDKAEQAMATMNTLPSPLLEGLIPLRAQRFVRWETRRGCQFKCSFCQHRQADARSERTGFPADRIEREIDLICAAKVEEVAVLDPVFNTNEAPGHAVRVLERFANHGFRGRLSLQCRAEFIDDAFLNVARRLNVCLEFGLQTIHHAEQIAIDRTNNMKKVEQALAKVREFGIDHEVSLIFGLPEQTLESFKASVRWCLERRIPVIKAFPLLLLRGTKLDIERDRWRLVVEDAVMPQVLASASFSREDRNAMEAISEALQQTEGNHPNFDELEARAKCCRPDRSRWQPESSKEAA